MKTKTSIRRLLLPPEHGSWAALCEPILAGLVAAPSWGGVLLAVASIGLFLNRPPAKAWLKERESHRDSEKRRRAGLLFAATAFIGLAALTAMVLIAKVTPALIAAGAIAAFLGGIHAAADLFGKGRVLPAEICGSVAPQFLAGAMVLLAGGDLLPAVVLTVLLAYRQVSTLSFVRYRLRKPKGRPVSLAFFLSAHLAGVVLAIILMMQEWANGWAGVAIGMLLVRSAIGFTRSGKVARPKQIGLTEAILGAAYALAAAFSI